MAFDSQLVFIINCKESNSKYVYNSACSKWMQGQTIGITINLIGIDTFQWLSTILL